jgi:hypothetical protein
MGTRVCPGGWKRPGRDADPSSLSSAEVLKQSRAIPLLSLRVFVVYKKGETYLPIYVAVDCIAYVLRNREPNILISIRKAVNLRCGFI